MYTTWWIYVTRIRSKGKSKVLVVVSVHAVVLFTDIENAFVSSPSSILQTTFIGMLNVLRHFVEIVVLVLLTNLVELPVLILWVSFQVVATSLHFVFALYGYVRLVDINDFPRRATQYFLVLAWLALLLLIIHECLFSLSERDSSAALDWWNNSYATSPWLDFSGWQSVSKSLENIASCVVHHDVVDLAVCHGCGVIQLLHTVLLRFDDLSTVIEIVEQEVQVLLMVLGHHVWVNLNVLLRVNLKLDLVLAMDVDLTSCKFLKSLQIFFKIASCSGFASILNRNLLYLCSLMHEVWVSLVAIHLPLHALLISRQDFLYVSGCVLGISTHVFQAELLLLGLIHLQVLVTSVLFFLLNVRRLSAVSSRVHEELDASLGKNGQTCILVILNRLHYFPIIHALFGLFPRCLVSWHELINEIRVGHSSLVDIVVSLFKETSGTMDCVSHCCVETKVISNART